MDATERGSPTQRRDGEALRLTGFGHVVIWDARRGEPWNTGQTLHEFGIYNLRESDIANVGVSPELWRDELARYDRDASLGLQMG